MQSFKRPAFSGHRVDRLLLRDWTWASVMTALMLVLSALIFTIAVPIPMSAQSTSCMAWVTCSPYSQYNVTCYPALPPGAYDCTTLDFTTYCKVRTNQCPPAAAQTENPRCIECEKKMAAGGNPINIATGDVYIDQTDVSIPGLGGGLRLTRSWNSLWPNTQSGFRIGMFGPNWRSNLEEHIFAGSDGYVKYLRGDGNFWSFGYNGSNWLPAAPANTGAVLTQSSTNWILTLKGGEQRLFDINSGSLVSIVDRNGNTTSLSFDGLNRLSTVTDAAGRHLSFSYASGSSYIVTGVSSDTGLSLTYTYDGDGRLLQVIRPDQSTLNFEYDPNPYPYANTPNPYITAIKDSSGKVLEAHTYDCYGRGLTSARAGGVDSITVTYSDSTYTGTCGGGRFFTSQ